jgi:hypothetical protein
MLIRSSSGVLRVSCLFVLNIEQNKSLCQMRLQIMLFPDRPDRCFTQPLELVVGKLAQKGDPPAVTRPGRTDVRPEAMTSAIRLRSANPARATCEYSQRSRHCIQSGGRVAFSSRDRCAPNEKKPELKRSRFSPSSQNLLTGCVKSQYTACIPINPSSATSVNQKSALPDGVRDTRTIVASVPPASPMPPPMVNPG